MNIREMILDNKYLAFVVLLSLLEIYVFRSINNTTFFYFLIASLALSAFIDKIGHVLRFVSTVKLISKIDESNLKLKKSEKKFKDFFMKSNIPMCIFDSNNLKFAEVNKNFIELMEYTEDELTSIPIKELILKEDYKGSLYALDLRLDEYVNRYVSKSGNILHFRWTGTKPDENGLSSCVATLLEVECPCEKYMKSSEKYTTS